ncbi:MAG: hypothetical protein SVW57_10520 [Thermodesulfobacteriota bacterium]|nr:hypothetical protein [Thermodesulfobacteriota bacterium]MDY6857660.1 hypothetical protein [Thermodesulfobacteriota bacterium]
MDKKEQKQFIKELVKNVQEEIEAKIPNLPENWDGIELRWLVRDHFARVVFDGYEDKRGKRFRHYQNEYIKNLY